MKVPFATPRRDLPKIKWNLWDSNWQKSEQIKMNPLEFFVMEKTHVVSEPSLLKFHCRDCLMIEANIILTNDRVANSYHHFEICIQFINWWYRDLDIWNCHSLYHKWIWSKQVWRHTCTIATKWVFPHSIFFNEIVFDSRLDRVVPTLPRGCEIVKFYKNEAGLFILGHNPI